jgi:hypothetical protein
LTNTTVATVTTTTTATNVTTVNGLAANVITAAATATDFGTEVAAAVWNSDATSYQTQGTFGQAIGDPVADTNTIFKAVVTDATGVTVGADVVAMKVDTAAILVDTGTTLDGRIPAALVGGRMDASVGAMAANVLTATAINADAITAAKVAADVHQETIELAFTYDATASYATATAGALVKEIADNAGGSALTAAAIADAVWDEAQADHVAAGSFGVTASEIADILVDTAEIGAAGAGLTNINLPNQTMDIVGNITGNLSGSVGSVTGAVGSVTGAVGSVTGLTASDVAAIKAKTDSLTYTVAGQVDANIESINTVTITGDGGTTPFDVA